MKPRRPPVSPKAKAPPQNTHPSKERPAGGRRLTLPCIVAAVTVTAALGLGAQAMAAPADSTPTPTPAAGDWNWVGGSAAAAPAGFGPDNPAPSRAAPDSAAGGDSQNWAWVSGGERPASATPPAVAAPADPACPSADGTLMFDAAAPPDADQAAQLFCGGGRVFGFYVASPSASHSWTLGEFQRVAAAGFRMVPIYVAPYHNLTTQRGQDDARRAVEAARPFAVPNAGLILDMEAEAWNADQAGTLAYAKAWAAEVRRSGNNPVIYGSGAMIRALAGSSSPDERFGGAWIGSYPNHVPPNPRVTDAFQERLFSIQGWQFQGDHVVPGVGASVDTSVVEPAFGL